LTDLLLTQHYAGQCCDEQASFCAGKRQKVSAESDKTMLTIHALQNARSNNYISNITMNKRMYRYTTKRKQRAPTKHRLNDTNNEVYGLRQLTVDTAHAEC